MKKWITSAVLGIQKFFESWRFAVLMLSILFLFVTFFAALIFLPAPATANDFVKDFKIWCFGYNPETGGMDWSYVWMFLSGPLVIAFTIFLIWGSSLKKIFAESPISTIPYFVIALTIVGSVGATLPGLYKPAQTAEAAEQNFKFPGERIRTSYMAPKFQLINHEIKPFDIEQMKGRVVMITAIYSTCGYACPKIMAQADEAIANLTEKERKNFTLAAITLDPENDTPEFLKKVAQSRDLKAPGFQFLSGKPGDVNKALDSYNFKRKKDPKTGIIDHSNLFILVDSKGRIAYQFTLGKTQGQWLKEGLKQLIKESMEEPDKKL